MDGFDAQEDEDNGYKKPAGRVVAYIGGLIGFVIASTLVWFLISHRGIVPSNTSSSPEEHPTSFALNVKGLAAPTATNYVYRVIGPPGTTATITYTNQDGSSGNVKHAVLPWSIATVTTDGSGLPAGSGMPPYISIRTNARGANGPITCQAFGDGKLSDQETSDEGATVISCGFPY
jgi:hypothetical protein